jgi:DNA-binding transcriptional regulator/RsmH inhibitor MraZ
LDEKPSDAPEIEHPDGMYPSRMDDRGRVKLPVVLKEYLEKFEDKRLFVTSLDRRIAQVYPIILWKQTKKFLENYTDEPEVAENLAFNAADLGAETEMDSQARVLFSPEVRRELGLEDQPVHLYVFGGHIEVLSPAVYEERKVAAKVKPKSDLATARRAGMK